jgi:hypothetical protein
MLKRFWFTFESSSIPSILNLGCGVTAYDLPDAQALLQRTVFPAYGDRCVKSITENIDISTLEEKHVRPNMGNPVVRGVWFPLT